MQTTFVTQKSCGDPCNQRPTKAQLAAGFTPWRAAGTPDKRPSPREEIEQMTRKVDAMKATVDRAVEAEIAAALAPHPDVVAMRNEQTGKVAAFVLPKPYWQQDKK